MKFFHFVFLILALVLITYLPSLAQNPVLKKDLYPFENFPEIVDDFGKEKPYYHQYYVSSPIIEVSRLKGKTIGDVFQFFLGHTSFAAPVVNDQPIFNGTRVIVDLVALYDSKLIEDPIVMKVDPLSMTVTNYTLPEHTLHAGKVQRHLKISNGWIVLETIGTGNNENLAAFTINNNQTLMKALWQKIDLVFAKYVHQALSSSSILFTSPKKESFRWTDFVCTYNGVYQSATFNKMQLRNTSFLMVGSSELNNIPVVNSGPKIKPNSSELQRLYIEKINRLANLDVIPTLYWNDQKARAIWIMKSHASIDILAEQGAANPQVLKTIYNTPQCLEFVDALIAGGNRLKIVWKAISYWPGNDALREEYERIIKQDDWLDYAKYNVLRFGWQNTMNGFLPARTSAEDVLLNKTFRKLFLKIDSNCQD